MRIILDANVAIAAVAARGICEAVVELCLERHQLILCEGILAELSENLRREIKVAPALISEYLDVLRTNALLLTPEAVPTDACRDPNGLMILGLVAPGKADVIVTGDQDLLVIKKYKNAHILSPRAFWEASRKFR